MLNFSAQVHQEKINWWEDFHSLYFNQSVMAVWHKSIVHFSDKLKTAETDLEIQQEENSHLLGRYNKMLADLQEKDNAHKRRYSLL